MGRFGAIKDARAARGGVYFEPGIYEVEILEMTGGDNPKTHETFFACEFLILASTCPARPVGSRVSWYQGLTQNGAFARIKGFLIKPLFAIQLNGTPVVEMARDDLANVDATPSEIETWIEAQIDDELTEMVVSPSQPCKGVRLRVTATAATSRDKKQPIVACKWYRFDETVGATEIARAK